MIQGIKLLNIPFGVFAISYIVFPDWNLSNYTQITALNRVEPDEFHINRNWRELLKLRHKSSQNDVTHT